ncbi:MAG: trypsin-like peptidase domain-containing protein [Actinomycetota bacterium]|nr:trypsin-like peptidase domain-containing protein [Actinomycetota bacterium]
MRKLGSVLALGALLSASCSFSDGGSEADDAASTTVSGGVNSSATDDTQPFDISQVEQSVVKIASEGTFIDPESGLQLNAAGVGSGAIISADGILVTNNHVVTGAALLRVYVPGSDEPVNAKVLGVSECSDLAVIDLEGDGYTALPFRTDPVITGLAVFAAGYPASDASTIEEVDFTLTRGIVSNLTASGETNWASVDSVLEHDARIRGGNSGGPLVDEGGRIVGFNYAGNDSSDQNYAISGDLAQPIIDQLQRGTSVDSIGVNGQAVIDDTQGLSGIWVASVDSGSPADNAGIAPGDIITELEGLALATDGTMSDYCDVIRTQGADSTMSLGVLRYATEEYLEGQLNGAPLEASFSFAQEFDETVEDGGSGAYGSYISVSDDSGAITVEVPADWFDHDGAVNPEFGPSIYAAPDLQSFIDTWDTQGVIVEASNIRTSAEIEAVLDEIDLSGGCVKDSREPYEDVLYAGMIDLWTDCGGTGTVAFVLAVSPPEGNYVIRLLIQAVEDRDLEAADHILNSFVATL